MLLQAKPMLSTILGRGRASGREKQAYRAVSALVVQTGRSKADGTFSNDVSGGSGICEDGMGGFKRGETIVKRHLARQGNDVTEKLTKCN